MEKYQSRDLVDAMRVKKGDHKGSHEATLHSVLDLFFLVGASREMQPKAIIRAFSKAYAFDKDLTLKCLFWARDVREGAGERRLFRIILVYLLNNHPKDINHLLALVPEYGRWDDLFYHPKIVNYSLDIIRKNLITESNLLAKWLPRKGPIASMIRRGMGLGSKHYRQLLVNLSDTVEQKMCAEEWNHINYYSVPSLALYKYKGAFYRNDNERFSKFTSKDNDRNNRSSKEEILPHHIVSDLMKGGKGAVENKWKELNNYMEDSADRIIPVCDVSASMGMYNSLPLYVSIALGIYISEHNEGDFKDMFVTFTEKPQLKKLQGFLSRKVTQMNASPAGYSINLVKVYDEILNHAVKNKTPHQQMPTKVLVVSDMEFDGTGNTTEEFVQKESSKKFLASYEMIERNYRIHKYIMPTLIFWNVNGKSGNAPALVDDRIGLVSGFSPNILKTILAGQVYNPIDLMLNTITGKRYAAINTNDKN